MIVSLAENDLQMIGFPIVRSGIGGFIIARNPQLILGAMARKLKKRGANLVNGDLTKNPTVPPL